MTDADDDVDAWKEMAADNDEEEDVDFGAIVQQTQSLDDGSGALEVIDKVCAFADKMRSDNQRTELDERGMVKCNNMVTLHVILHGALAMKIEQKAFRLDVKASEQLDKIKTAVIDRMGSLWPSDAKLRLSWLQDDGDFFELTQSLWKDYVFMDWERMPWYVYASDNEADAGEMLLSDTA